MIDTGSHFSLLSNFLAQRLHIKIQPMTPETHQSLFSASGSRLQLLGTAEVTLDISGLKIPHTFYICENLAETAIIGREFLDDSSAVIDFRNQTITVSDFLEIPLQHKIGKDNFVRAKDSLCIKPQTEVIFPVICSKKFNNQEILLSPIPGEQFRRFAIANAICEVKNNQTVCRLFNSSDECLVLCPNQKIALATVFEDSSRCLLISQNQGSESTADAELDDPTVDDAMLEMFAAEYQFNINSNLPVDVRCKLLRVLFRRKEAFARSLADLKTYNKEQFEVRLKSTRPLINKQYKHKAEHNRILQHHIDEWEKCGIVEKSENYFFRNNIFLVPKASLKSASDPHNPIHYRPVCDLRALNERVEKLVTFTPSPSDLIQEVTKLSDEPPHEGPHFYSSFDFLHGFFQLSLRPGISREVFGFTAPSGQHFNFCKIPFGFINSPFIFNKTIGKITAPLRATGSFCVYTDDSLIFTVSADEHIQRIDEFLAILIQNDLKCSVKKTFLMQTEIRYLGVDIGPQGISIPESVNRALDKLTSMKISSPKSVQKFLWFCNFWRAHVPNLAQRTYNLRQLIHKEVPFRFTAECQKEREDVINALRTAGPLTPISPSEPLYVFVDSSKHGIGISVCQGQHQPNDPQTVQKHLSHIRRGQPRLRPIMHLSYTLGKAQQNYGSTALELYGLQRALLTLDHLATAREIHVISDNVGVTSFAKLKVGNARERRMLAYLQQFNLYLHFIKGSEHRSSDFLSRIGCDLSPAEKVLWKSEDNDDFLDDFLFSITSDNNDKNMQHTSGADVSQWKVYLCQELNEGINTNNHSAMQMHAQTHLSHASELVSTVSMDCNHQHSSNAGHTLNALAAPFYPYSLCVDLSNQPLNVDSIVLESANEDDIWYDAISDMADLDNLSQNLSDHSQNFETATVNVTRNVRKRAKQSCNTAPPIESTTAEQDEPSCESLIHDLPILRPQHYVDDPEFASIWKYLSTGDLSGDKKIDYETAIIAPLYTIENEKLYRFNLPRSKKRSADGLTRKVVAIPKTFQQAVLDDLHFKHGHAAGERLFETARLSIYFKNLYSACFAIANTCTLCQRTKIDRRKQVPELYSTPIFGPGKVFALDFKVLPRRTSSGHTAILAIIETFSGFAYFEGVPDQTALTTARVLIRRILPEHPEFSGLISDRGSAFVAQIFKTITSRVLGLSHFHSSSYQAQSHGVVENCILQLNRLIPLYADNDRDISDVLPLIELVSRITISKPRSYSPYQILRGFQPKLQLIGDVLSRDEPVLSQHEYVQWLKEKLKVIHHDVQENLIHARGQQKAMFDKRHHVKSPDWTVGDRVWLERANPKPRSDQILTHKRFGSGPWFISKIVQREASTDVDVNAFPSLNDTAIGPAYQLVHCHTGKVIKNLVPSRRLKRCNDRSKLDPIYPPLRSPETATAETSIMQNEDNSVQPTAAQPQATENSSTQPAANKDKLPEGWEQAKCILRKRVRDRATEFLILFHDKSRYWCQDADVSDELKKRFFLKKAQERNRRQKAARERFH